MSKQLTIKGPLSKDFQQVYVDDEPTGLFINNEGKIKASNSTSNTINGEIGIGDTNQLHLNDNTIISRSSSDLEIIATAGIDLEPENGVIQFIKKDGYNHTVIGNIQIEGGGLTIAPINLGNLTLDVGGTLTQDSGIGRFVASKGGTEFSATNSAYAGMILGYTRIQNDGTGASDLYISMDATLTVLQTTQGTNVSITFVAPPSGNVEIVFSCSLYASSKTIEFALSDNATHNEISEEHTYDGGAQSSDETDANMTVVSWAVTGLTAGTSYTYYISGAETISGTSFIRHGRFRDSGVHYPPIIVKAIALPATITTGE
tara:strand:+ start:1086 stop:2036 length:951 start_codon:yes stop_codon:yes gene_type:complete